MNKPISIILPTYNNPDTLSLCLRSIIEGQSNPDNQIILIDDSGTDINQEVLSEYKDSVNILALDKNYGLCRGTNLGVYNAKQTRILILNDDNIVPRMFDKILNEQMDQAEKNGPSVLSPNQIEPYPSMFPQFHIQNLGRNPKNFDLEAFWKYENIIANNLLTEEGSTLPIFMNKIDYMKIGGWDENYPTTGIVCDWDFFLKCNLNGFKMMRTYACNFYHFVSLSTPTPETKLKRNQLEQEGHNYAQYKWSSPIIHNPKTNLKTILNS